MKFFKLRALFGLHTKTTFVKRRQALPILAFAISLISAIFSYSNPEKTSAAILKQINYQGRLTNLSGEAVTDGSYDIVFKLYDVPTDGTPLWTGNYTSANGNPIQTVNGVFSVLLGGGTGNSMDSIDFSSNTYYLGVKVGSDSEMTPRKRLSAVPQAFNANSLIGDGKINITGAPSGTSVNSGTVFINPGSAAANNTLMGVAVGGVEKLKLDAEGDLVVSGTITSNGSTLTLSGNAELNQNLTTTSAPAFSKLTLSDTSNQLSFGTTNVGTLTWVLSGVRTLTLPDATDTLVGRNTTDTLTNKTMSTGSAWQGDAVGLSYGGTGLTAAGASNTILGMNAAGNAAEFKALTQGSNVSISHAANSITLAVSATPSFTTVNGLSLTANADGFSISGGTASRQINITGSDITLSGGGNTLTLTGSATLNQDLATTSTPTFSQ